MSAFAHRRVRAACTIGRVIVTAGLLASPAALAAQVTGIPQDPFPFGGGTLQVSVLTIGPGDQVFERFGHNAIRIRDSMSGLDLAYNWGMFSFSEPQFIRRFLSGDTRYWVQAFPTTWLIEAYIGQERKITEQVLELTPEQRATVARIVVENAKPANKYYRYDYFRDNCSTRVRDVIDSALAGALGRRFKTIQSPWTYRSEAVRLTTPDAFAQAGIELALGPRADEQMTAWEAMYIPMRLRDYIREVTVPGADGKPIAFVQDEQVRYQPPARAEEPAERRGLTLGAWGPILGIWMLLLAPVSLVWRRRTRIPAAVTAMAWYAITGIIGTAILAMWLFSAHVFWYDNLNLLLVSPLGLFAAWPVTRAILRGRADRTARIAVVVVLVQLALAVLLAPFGIQRLVGPLLLLLPAHLGLLVAYWRHVRSGAAAVAEAR